MRFKGGRRLTAQTCSKVVCNLVDTAKLFGYLLAMDAKDFVLWRERCGLSQERAAERLGVTRTTIQNWESAATSISPLAAKTCEVWEHRLKQENPSLGPVTLNYTDAPMWLDPFGPRRLAMLQQEPFRTNSAALGRVIELWGQPSFHSPLIVTELGEVLWNAVELQRVVSGQDADAPTPDRWRARVVTEIAAYLEKSAMKYPVRNGPKLLDDDQLAEFARVGSELVRALEGIAGELSTSTITYRDVAEVLERGKNIGLFPAPELASELARAFQ